MDLGILFVALQLLTENGVEDLEFQLNLRLLAVASQSHGNEGQLDGRGGDDVLAVEDDFYGGSLVVCCSLLIHNYLHAYVSAALPQRIVRASAARVGYCVWVLVLAVYR